MSKFVCCVGSDSKGDGGNGALPDDNYLLPGGAWDPSISTSPVRASSTRYRRKSTNRSRPSTTNTSSFRTFWSKKFSRSRSGVEGTLADSCGEYQAPPLVPSRTLPSSQDFRLLKTVGRGAFGKVMLAVHSETRILYALKVVPKAKITTKKQVEQILAESRILKSIRHPFCVALQYSFQSDDFLFYVFEFAAGGMLFYHLRNSGKFLEPRARFYFGQIILALDYLHSFGIIFRDLKPENCMLGEQGHIVLTDFGSAKMLEVSEKTSTIAGTPQYIAPEVLRGELYSFSADWWSCGILLYEMLTGKTPFYSADRVELYKLVLNGFFTVPRGVSPRAKSLMHRLINKDQTKRIGCDCGSCQYHSAADIKQHSFFSRLPMSSDEEGLYTMEEAEREWERERPRSRNNSFFNTASSFIRTVSVSARRMSMTVSPYAGVPCEWAWEDLEARKVAPPFKPLLNGPTDLRNFDPTLTCIPPTLSDLITTERSLHVDDFDYVAPEDPNTGYRFKNSPDRDTAALTVEVVGGAAANGNSSKENSTDEEKVFIKSKADAAPAVVPVLEGRFVEGGLPLERSGTAKVVVTAEINS